MSVEEGMVEEAKESTGTECAWKALKEYRDRLDEWGEEDLKVEYDNLIEKVMVQQESIKRSGVINMLDKAGVVATSEEMGFAEHSMVVDGCSADGYIDMAEESVDVGK